MKRLNWNTLSKWKTLFGSWPLANQVQGDFQLDGHTGAKTPVSINTALFGWFCQPERWTPLSSTGVTYSFTQLQP